MLIVVLCAIFSVAFSCTSNVDCWNNGECKNSQCVCEPSWKGADCSVLNLLPAPVVGAYGYKPNVTSWGGVPIFVDGLYHLYVAEMVDGCGLCAWGSNSRVVHTTSRTLLGPYTFVDEALPVWSHNPQIAIDNSTGTPTYLLFHIGNADGGNPKHCNTEGFSTLKNTKLKGQASGVLHTSNSLNGPWIPQNPPGLPGCNNPAPYVSADGSIFVVCTWVGYKAPSWKGPYTRVDIKFTGDPGRGNWEDPFIWYDTKYKVWKLLSHVWIGTGNEYATRVGGYGYSYDTITWVRSPKYPFNVTVEFQDGSGTDLTTRERPKLFFAPDKITPLALFNGVASVPKGNKDKCGADWTYTLAQPINH